MKTRLTLRPGQNGTKKLQGKYGDRLLAVRYRYDDERRVRIKTVELIEEELPWIMAPRRKPEEPILLRLEFPERELREAVKAAGGIWQPERKLWQLTYGQACRLGIEQRIVE